MSRRTRSRPSSLRVDSEVATAALALGFLAACADSPTIPSSPPSARLSLDNASMALPWLDEIAAGYTETWDAAGPTGLVAVSRKAKEVAPLILTKRVVDEVFANTLRCGRSRSDTTRKHGDESCQRR